MCLQILVCAVTDLTGLNTKSHEELSEELFCSSHFRRRYHQWCVPAFPLLCRVQMHAMWLSCLHLRRQIAFCSRTQSPASVLSTCLGCRYMPDFTPEQKSNPLLSPHFAKDLSKLPPAFVLTAEVGLSRCCVRCDRQGVAAVSCRRRLLLLLLHLLASS